MPWPTVLKLYMAWWVDEPYLFWGHWVKGQGHSDLEHKILFEACPSDNSTMPGSTVLKLDMEVRSDK